jgi:hypothetical protein
MNTAKLDLRGKVICVFSEKGIAEVRCSGT